MPSSAPLAADVTALFEQPAPPRRRPRAGFAAALEAFRADPDPADVFTPEPGSTPLPEELAGLRMVFGGASRADLESLYLDAPANRHAAPTERYMIVRERTAEALRLGRLSRGLHVFVGPTGGGKTGLALALVLAAILEGHPCVYVSLELDEDELAARLIGLAGSVAWSRLSLRRPLHRDPNRCRELGDQKRAAIDALQAVAGLLYVVAPDPGPDDDLPCVTDYKKPTQGGGPDRVVSGVRSLVRAVAAEHERTPLVVFDYLQAPGMYAFDPAKEIGLDPRQRIGRLAMALRHLSKADADDPAWIGCPVVVLSTTARSNTAGKLSTPGMDGTDPDRLRKATLEDLKALGKESGEIEATAVTCWALSVGESDSGDRRFTLRLAKNRKGPAGQWLPFLFTGATGELRDDPERYRLAQVEDAAAAETTQARRQSRTGAPAAVAANPPAGPAGTPPDTDDEALNLLENWGDE